MTAGLHHTPSDSKLKLIHISISPKVVEQHISKQTQNVAVYSRFRLRNRTVGRACASDVLVVNYCLQVQLKARGWS